MNWGDVVAGLVYGASVGCAVRFYWRTQATRHYAGLLLRQLFEAQHHQTAMHEQLARMANEKHGYFILSVNWLRAVGGKAELTPMACLVDPAMTKIMVNIDPQTNVREVFLNEGSEARN